MQKSGSPTRRLATIPPGPGSRDRGWCCTSGPSRSRLGRCPTCCLDCDTRSVRPVLLRWRPLDRSASGWCRRRRRPSTIRRGSRRSWWRPESKRVLNLSSLQSSLATILRPNYEFVKKTQFCEDYRRSVGIRLQANQAYRNPCLILIS